MTEDKHNRLSSYREMLLEHLFTGELMRHVWLSSAPRLEVLKPQVDDGGYDLVVEGNGILRHLQLKATFRGSSVGRFNINSGLASKPGGCVIVLLFDPTTLELGPYLWFGGPPGHKLPALLTYQVATHTKRNKDGVKGTRSSIRVVPRAAFRPVRSIADLATELFGPMPERNDGQAEKGSRPLLRPAEEGDPSCKL